MGCNQQIISKNIRVHLGPCSILLSIAPCKEMVYFNLVPRAFLAERQKALSTRLGFISPDKRQSVMKLLVGRRSDFFDGLTSALKNNSRGLARKSREQIHPVTSSYKLVPRPFSRLVDREMKCYRAPTQIMQIGSHPQQVPETTRFHRFHFLRLCFCIAW